MIGPMPRMTFEVRGLAGLEQAFEAKLREALPEPITFEVKTTATSSKKGGVRSAAMNRTIADVQARAGRNPFFINPKTRKQIIDAARGLVSATAGARQKAKDAIESLLLTGIGENFLAQKNPGGGSFASLSENYIAQKRRKFGFVTPIMKAAGDLLGGLKVEERRK